MALSLDQRLTRLRVRLEELRYWRIREGVAEAGGQRDRECGEGKQTGDESSTEADLSSPHVYGSSEEVRGGHADAPHGVTGITPASHT